MTRELAPAPVAPHPNPPAQPQTPQAPSGHSRPISRGQMLVVLGVLGLAGLMGWGIRWLTEPPERNTRVVAATQDPTPAPTEPAVPVSTRQVTPVSVSPARPVDSAMAATKPATPSTPARAKAPENTAATNATDEPPENDVIESPLLPAGPSRDNLAAAEQGRTEAEAKRQQVQTLLNTQAVQLAFFTTNGLQQITDNLKRIDHAAPSRRKALAEANSRTRGLILVVAKGQASLLRDWQHLLPTAQEADLQKLLDTVTANAKEMELRRQQAVAQLKEIDDALAAGTTKKSGILQSR